MSSSVSLVLTCQSKQGSQRAVPPGWARLSCLLLGASGLLGPPGLVVTRQAPGLSPRVEQLKAAGADGRPSGETKCASQSAELQAGLKQGGMLMRTPAPIRTPPFWVPRRGGCQAEVLSWGGKGFGKLEKQRAKKRGVL